MSMDQFLSSLTEEQKAALLKALTSKPSDVEQNKDDSFTVKPKNNINQQQRRREPVKAKENTWTDTGEDKHVSTPQYQPTPRTREKSNKVSMNCHACGKTFSVDPRFVYGEFYRCDRCSSRR